MWQRQAAREWSGQFSRSRRSLGEHFHQPSNGGEATVDCLYFVKNKIFEKNCKNELPLHTLWTPKCEGLRKRGRSKGRSKIIKKSRIVKRHQKLAILRAVSRRERAGWAPRKERGSCIADAYIATRCSLAGPKLRPPERRLLSIFTSNYNYHFLSSCIIVPLFFSSPIYFVNCNESFLSFESKRPLYRTMFVKEIRVEVWAFRLEILSESRSSRQDLDAWQRKILVVSNCKLTEEFVLNLSESQPF